MMAEYNNITTTTTSSYPPGFENCGILPLPSPLNLEDVVNNEPSLLSSLLETSIETNFISENSWNSILLKPETSLEQQQQDNNGFGDLAANIGLTSSPYRRQEGTDRIDGIIPRVSERNHVSSHFFPTSLSDIAPIEYTENGRSWNYEHYQNGSKEYAEELTQQYFDSPLQESKHAIFGNKALDNDLSFLDSSVESSDLSKGSNSFMTGSTSFLTDGNNTSGIWDTDSPARNNGVDPDADPDAGMLNSKMHLIHQSAIASRLSHRECIQLLQTLVNSLGECKDSDLRQASQIISLMQVIQGQLLTEINAILGLPPSPKTPPRHPNSVDSLSSLDSPVDRAAKFHREIAITADAAFTWSGQLPPRTHRNPTYSCKIFLGGVPFDITEEAVIQSFKAFGNVKIEWPRKEIVPSQPKGYMYLIFEHEKQVKHLLQNCFMDYSQSIVGDWYFKLTSKRFREKDVQIIPWTLSDSNYVKLQAAKIDAKKTIFVGALHGMLNAEGLATIMNDLFGGVVYAGIDTDRYKYPIGSGRVTFNNMKSYMKAVSAAFVEIKTKFKKKVQVDPYLEDATCSVCHLQQGPYFCREWCCFQYFCRTCYQTQHNTEEYRKHRPLMRNASKPQGTMGAVTAVTLSPLGNRNYINNGTNNYNGYNNYNGSNNNGRYERFSGNGKAYNPWSTGNTGYNNNNNMQQRNDYGVSRYSNNSNSMMH